MKTLPSHCVEMELLIACCQHVLSPYKAEDFLASFAQHFDESLFISLAEQHRLLLVVFNTLIIPFKARLPKEFVTLISRKALQIQVKQLDIERMMFEINDTFNAHHIQHVFLKGPSLNQILFADKILRYSNDLDILVLPNDVLKAHDIMQEFDFKSRISIETIKWHSRFHCLSRRKDVIYDRDNTSFPIELHWKTHEIELLFVRPTEWLHHRLFYPYKQKSMPVLSHELHCLYLCCHAIKHAWERLRWLFDIVLFIERHQLDCNRLLALAQTYHLKNAMLETLVNIHEVFLIDYMPLLEKKPQLNVLEKMKRTLYYRCNPLPEQCSQWKKLHRLYCLNQLSSRYYYQLKYWSHIGLTIIKSRIKTSWTVIKTQFE
jgi:hypothetical protein